MNREIIEAIKAIEREKGIDSETLLLALEDALLAAYKKTPGAAEHARVEIDRETGDMQVFHLLVDEDDELRTLPQEEPVIPEGVDPEDVEPPEPEIDWDAYADEEIEVVDVSRDNFGRIAAQTAKQVILQRIREAEREMMFEEYVDRVGDVVTGIVQQSDHRYTLVDLGRVEALLPESEQVHGERYDHGSRVKAVITDVRSSAKGPQVIVSRRSDQLVKELFKLEVPEMADGLVEIQNVAREPGWRSKIAVISHVNGVDPVGACVGPRGSRVRMVVSELRGEKIDIIPFNDEPARYIAKALSPARVREVIVDDENRQATVVVPDDQLSLAIGREGMNARLAARLTGWRIDIKSESTYSNEGTGDDEEVSGGRCAAVLRNQRRCPNQAEAGSRFCSLPEHAKLAGLEAELGRSLTNSEALEAGAPGVVEPTPEEAPEPVDAGADGAGETTGGISALRAEGDTEPDPGAKMEVEGGMLPTSVGEDAEAEAEAGADETAATRDPGEPEPADGISAVRGEDEPEPDPASKMDGEGGMQPTGPGGETRRGEDEAKAADDETAATGAGKDDDLAVTEDEVPLTEGVAVVRTPDDVEPDPVEKMAAEGPIHEHPDKEV